MKTFTPSQLSAINAAILASGGKLRHKTRDGAITFDAAANQFVEGTNVQRGKVFDRAYLTQDAKTYDSTGAFLIGELERLDPKIHMPLTSVTYGRDIDLREDVSIADDFSSYTQSAFGAPGSLGAGNGIRNGKSWIGKSTDQLVGISLDIGKIMNPLTPWGMEVKYTVFELESALKLGRPIDDQKIMGVKLKQQMDTDEQVYVGDASLTQYGLFNNPLVTNVSNVPNGAGGTPQWATKTPQEMLADVNALITSAWAASAWSVMPTKILLPPAQFGFISTQNVSSAGNQSILKYLLENNILVSSGKGKIDIQPAKWLIGAGTGGTIGQTGTVDRMVAYTQDPNYVRFPMTPLLRTPIQFISIYHLFSYYCKLGVVELVYPETMAYRDGI